MKDLALSENYTNMAIACFDLGEFCRFHPYGRNILETIGAKTVIMSCAKHNDNTVKENALLALQKIMLHNW